MAFPMAVLFVAMVSIYLAETQVVKAERTVSRSYETRSELARLHGSLFQAQTSRAAYLTTGRPEFLAVYGRARADIGRSLTRLPGMISGDSATAAEFRPLPDMVRNELALLDGLPGRQADELAAMSAVLAQLARVSADEQRFFGDAQAGRDAARSRMFFILAACAVLGPLSVMLIHLLVAGRVAIRIQIVQENARRLAHGLPLEPIVPGTDEISQLAHQLEDAAVLLRARERDLGESERRYRDLFDRAPIPYEETDREGVVRRCNQAVCALLKSPPERILGRPAWNFVTPDQQEAIRAAMQERLEHGVETGPFECDYMLEDGSRIAVEVRENLVRNDHGEPIGVVRSLLDVTERNLAAIAARKVEQYAMELRNKNEQLARALDAARSATEAKSRFLASVSHELRTPLNGIIGFSELMHDGRLGPVSPEQMDVLGDILTSARHLLQLISDILDLSKVEAGKMEFRPEDCRVATLVNEVRDVVRPLAERKRLHLSVETPPDLTAHIDTARFKQILYNYLSNAVKFTPEDGSVALRVSRNDDAYFKVEVEDTGIGIPPGEISQLFQEFQQLPNSRKAEQGTGLGLALTRHIVEAQGGSVSVRSVLGQGSVFSAVLPVRAVLTSANRTI